MMAPDALCFFYFLIFTVPKIPTTTAAAAYTASDFILLNCGASTSSNDTSNRSWDSDKRSEFAPATTSSASTAAKSDVGVPYDTVRVFHSPSTYTFPVALGAKFVRLYFCSSITDFTTSQSFFSVTANSFTLLSNFSAFLYSQNSSQFSFMKEFVINVQESPQLDLTFVPNPNSFAFINGIEIVSIPNKIYFRGNDVPIKFVDVNAQVSYLDSSTTALENVYRLNVGGGRVEIQDDSGMFRAWSGDDDDYLFRAAVGDTSHAADNLEINYSIYTTPYFAPEIVYTTARVTTNRSLNLEWRFPVDSGFFYLLRLHFCEFNPDVTRAKQRVFNIEIDDVTAEDKADVVNLAGAARIPIYRDCMAWLPNDGSHGKQFLWLSMFPNLEVAPRYPSALLNGLEIFKLNDTKGSLAGANPEVTMKSSPAEEEKKKSYGYLYVSMGSVIAALAVVGIGVLSFFILQRRRKRMKPSLYSSLPISNASSSTTATGTGLGVLLHSEFCRCFSFDEIKTATCNFDRNFIIGKGGFGYVYRGIIDNGATTVAIKRLNPSSNQGAHEFLTEIQMLSKLRHFHLVSLIGCCDEQGEMILVYDYMAHGSLRDHLYNSENSPLSWNQRLEICMGAAKGLNYLHTGTEHAIIHRDVKSTNILLDENWVAKIADFGLSKMGNTNDSFTHISTNVKGTFHIGTPTNGWTPHAVNLQINYTSQTPPYSAPAIVYATSRVANYSKSLEWRFHVDSGFHYLLRLHFCEIQQEVTEQNQRVFTIIINNQTAEVKADVVLWTGGNGIPIFRDYITWVPDDGHGVKQKLLLRLTPNVEGNPKYNSTLLNGLEVFKLIKYFNRSVVKGGPEPVMDPPLWHRKKKSQPFVIYIVIGRVISLLAVVAAVSFLIFRQQKAKGSATKNAYKSLWNLLSTATRTSGSGVALHNLCRHFSLDEIKTATHNFDGNSVIGRGGFGDVYKGLIDNGATTVAIKRLNPLSNQGAREFLTEIQMLSNLRHRHLVSLIGYCNESGEMILVYDYMAHGTLRDHLHDSEKSPITWKQRLQICLGAAKGLDYLHTGTKQAIIHRDVKSTNILLDLKWMAKISDFGLSKMGPANDSFTHISTNIKGTFGYLDPEYFLTSKLTRKSDVYAFGVVLFEVLARRPAVDMKLDEEQHSLAGWARQCIQEGKLDKLIDKSLSEQIAPACLESFVGIAGRCLHIQAQQRPAMADIVLGLELAMALQQESERDNDGTS